MNTEKMEGAWEEFKGRMKMAYADLTDDDFLRAQGSRDKLYGIVKQRFGEEKEQIERRLAHLRVPPPVPAASKPKPH